jgi:Integrase zinc binding domain
MDPPESDISLQLRILVVAHCGASGHRSQAAMLSAIQKHFSWNGLKSDVQAFYSTCLNCVSTTGGSRIPRPFGEALHASKPNMVLHFDYMFVGPGDNGNKYILLLKDDASGYVWLCPHVMADASSTVESLVHWFSVFTVCKTWCSDQGSHFKNQVVDGVMRALRCQHTFTVDYSPWSNGTIEVVCREVLRALRSLVSELKLQFHHWPALVPIVQSMLNNQPADRLDGIAPVTAMTSLQPVTPLLSVLSPMNGLDVLTLDQINAEKIANIGAIQLALHELHRSNSQTASDKRIRRRANRNSASGAALLMFSLGDFVLVGTLAGGTQHKLAVKWRGPRTIVAVESDWVFQVGDLLTRATQTVHASRLKFYYDSSLHVTESLLEHVAHQ